MAYNDPYSRPYASHDQYNAQEQYNPQDQYAPHQQYTDGPEYNPYGGEGPHQTYAQEGYQPYGAHAGGYRDEPRVQSPEPLGVPPAFQSKEAGYSNDIPSEFRKRKYAGQSGLWTAGGGLRCCGRFFLCTILVFFFLLISIVLALLLWVRPPNIVIGSIIPPTSSDVSVTSTGLTIPLSIDISVDNPNYFAVDFNKISVDLTYPIDNTPVGNGTKSAITFHSNSQTNFTLPFNVTYSTADDPNDKILVDIATKCGVIGSSKSDITIDYEITLGLHLGLINISPSISNSMSFACPLTSAEIQSIGGSILGGL